MLSFLNNYNLNNPVVTIDRSWESSMEKKFSLKVALNSADLKRMENNHTYWESNSDKFESSHEVSWGDKNMMFLEIENILPYIKEKDFVLDVGCSNGYTTFKVANSKKVQIIAFDYSKKAISSALLRQKEERNGKRISFLLGNALNIDSKNSRFDKAYSIRVMINLPTWDMQRKAILEVHRVLKKGGLYLFSEAFLGSLQKLNELRATVNLKPLIVHEFNLYLDEAKLEKFIEPYFEIVDVKKFSSIYYVASRFLRYLTMERGDVDSFSNEINNLFVKYKETSQSGDFGIQKLYVLRKK